MFSFPFPDSINVSCVRSDALAQCYLHPEEERLLSPQAVEKRRREFLMGRTAARNALAGLGISKSLPILRGERREPLWPEGVVGSITHAGDYAVSAVAYRKDIVSIGIDIEKVKHDRVGEIARTIADEQEQHWIQQEPDNLAQRTLLVFSAKESIFKALYPLCRVFLDYSAVSLTLTDVNRFSAELSEKSKSIFASEVLLASIERIAVDFQIYSADNNDQYVQTSTYLSC